MNRVYLYTVIEKSTGLQVLSIVGENKEAIDKQMQNLFSCSVGYRYPLRDYNHFFTIQEIHK